MSAPIKKIGLADLVKNTIEDMALTHAINGGLKTAVILPTVEFKTNLVQKRKLEFLQSFLDDFALVKDGKTKADIFKMVTFLSSSKPIANFRNIGTRNILQKYARVKVGNSFVCLSLETEKTILVRIISKKEITRYFLKVH